MAYQFNPPIDFTPADTPPFTQLLGINDATNKIVGVHNANTNQAFFWTPPTTFVNITPTGSTASTGTGINNPGQIVGFYLDANGVTHGWTDINGAFITVDEPGTAFNQLLGINDFGQMAGYSSDMKNGLTDQLAYLRQGNGTYTLIDNATHTANLPVNVNSQATGVDNHGDVVGFYMPTTTTSFGFLLPAGGTKALTLQYPGAAFTQALGINNVGEVVGTYNDAAGAAHGFVFSIGSGTYFDITAPNATATTINGINDPGEAVGFDTDAAGNTHGVAVPIPQLEVVDTTKGTAWQQAAQSYTATGLPLTGQYISPTQDSVNLIALSDNLFLHSGPGVDALEAHGGFNVLDGGTNSNFLINGSGNQDVDYLDARGNTAPLWSTVVNFHANDLCVLWGITQTNFSLTWQDNQGAPGYTGLTGTFSAPGKQSVKLTLSGHSMADLNNTLRVSFGTDAASGSPFMAIQSV